METRNPMSSKSDAKDAADETPVTELSYTEASRELDTIVEFFENRDVDVDQLVPKLERATAIVDELDRRVRKTRTQVEQLVPRLQAAARSADAEDEDPYDEGLEDDE
jgi:exodeoxyribonuclease VII small subunit